MNSTATLRPRAGDGDREVSQTSLSLNDLDFSFSHLALSLDDLDIQDSPSPLVNRACPPSLSSDDLDLSFPRLALSLNDLDIQTSPLSMKEPAPIPELQDSAAHTDETRAPNPTHQEAPGPLLSFHLFPKLPLELRRVIWAIIASHLRLIKVETPSMVESWLERYQKDQRYQEELERYRTRGPNSKMYRPFPFPFHRNVVLPPRTHHTHHRINVPEASMQIPPILLTCHESRKEGLRFYTGRLNANFSDNEDKDYSVDINPKVDIIYFGPNSCPWTVSECIRHRGGGDFQRIAVHIDVLENGLRCTECGWDSYRTFPSEMLDNVDILNILHGTHYLCWVGGRFGVEKVFLSLKEVFLVGRYKTRCSVGEVACLEGREVDASLGLCRPSESDEMVPLEDDLKEKVDVLNRDILKVRDGTWKPTKGENRWVGEKKPVFEWMKLCL